jgi:hypothetical protein
MENSRPYPIKCLFLKQQSTFHSLPTAIILFARWKSSITSHGTDVSKNQFHKGIGFSQEIDSVESMPGILKTSKIRVQQTIVSGGLDTHL